MATGNTRAPSAVLGTGDQNFQTNPNTLIPKLLALALPVLRRNSVMRSLVNTDYDGMAKMKGDSIDIPLPPRLAVSEVNPSSTPETGQAVDFGNFNLKLDCWYQAHFRISDRELLTVDTNSFYSTSAGEAVAQLADKIDGDIMNNYKRVYRIVGDQTGGTAQTGSTDYADPFIPATSGTEAAGLNSIVQAGRVLNDERAYPHDRRLVISPRAQANAVQLRPFNDYSWNQDMNGIAAGQLGTKFGFEAFMSQNVVTHTTGAAGTYTVNGAQDAGATTLMVSTADGTANAAPVEGDIFIIGDDEDDSYVVTADAAAISGTTAADFSISISPGLRAGVADNATMTFKPSHQVNLAFQRGAFVFASRPLETVDVLSGNLIRSIYDPVSGIVLRLEVERQNKQSYYSFDVLYGTGALRPEMAVRLAGAE